MNERDRKAADDWMREHLPDRADYSFEDNEEEEAKQSYFFLRYRDSATVVYKVAVKDGKVTPQATPCQRSEPASAEKLFGDESCLRVS